MPQEYFIPDTTSITSDTQPTKDWEQAIRHWTWRFSFFFFLINKILIGSFKQVHEVKH